MLSKENAELRAKLATASGRVDYSPTQAQIEALKECADDLDIMINDYYDNTLDYPSQKRKYDRDMEVVKKARSSIAALTAAVEAGEHDEIVTTSFAINRSLSDASLKALSLGPQAIMERMADLEALTATANVKPVATITRAEGEFSKLEIQIAAAEAGWRDGKTGWRDGHLIADKIEQDTIERCAQIAEDILGPDPQPEGFDVPAAIRALKDPK